MVYMIKGVQTESDFRYELRIAGYKAHWNLLVCSHKKR